MRPRGVAGPACPQPCAPRAAFPRTAGASAKPSCPPLPSWHIRPPACCPGAGSGGKKPCGQEARPPPRPDGQHVPVGGLPSGFGARGAPDGTGAERARGVHTTVRPAPRLMHFPVTRSLCINETIIPVLRAMRETVACLGHQKWPCPASEGFRLPALLVPPPPASGPRWVTPLPGRRRPVQVPDGRRGLRSGGSLTVVPLTAGRCCCTPRKWATATPPAKRTSSCCKSPVAPDPSHVAAAGHGGPSSLPSQETARPVESCYEFIGATPMTCARE